MKAYDDEIFGPVLGVTRVDTYDEAVELVNDNPYGNGTAIFTRDGGVARRFQFEVQAGMVGINVPIPVPVAYYSFGGLEGVALRRHAHLRAGRDLLLHARQGGHVALAGPGDVEGRSGLPADALTSGARAEARSSPRRARAAVRAGAGDATLIDAVSAHLERHVPGEQTVWHELVSDLAA